MKGQMSCVGRSLVVVMVHHAASVEVVRASSLTAPPSIQMGGTLMSPREVARVMGLVKGEREKVAVPANAEMVAAAGCKAATSNTHRGGRSMSSQKVVVWQTTPQCARRVVSAIALAAAFPIHGGGTLMNPREVARATGPVQGEREEVAVPTTQVGLAGRRSMSKGSAVHHHFHRPSRGGRRQASVLTGLSPAPQPPCPLPQHALLRPRLPVLAAATSWRIGISPPPIFASSARVPIQGPLVGAVRTATCGSMMSAKRLSNIVLP